MTRKATNFKLKQMKDPLLELVKVWPKKSDEETAGIATHRKRVEAGL